MNTHKNPQQNTSKLSPTSNIWKIIYHQVGFSQGMQVSFNSKISKDNSVGVKQTFQQMMLNQLDMHIHKNEFHPFLTP